MCSARLLAVFAIVVPVVLPEARRFAEEEGGHSTRFNSARSTNQVRKALKRWFFFGGGGSTKYLKHLTRYGNLDDEEQFPLLVPRATRLTVRVEACFDFNCQQIDPHVKPRLATPFEHVCGGARGKREPRKGHDGPTQWMSFSNGDQYPNVREDCNMTWDIGQRRMIVKEKDVLTRGGFVVDLSDRKKAYKWCYEGGYKTSQRGKIYHFLGAKDIKPWRYKCAIIAFKNYTASGRPSGGTRSKESITAKWWDLAGSRKLIAERCVKWALDSKEVLVLPNPDKIEKGIANNEVLVDNDRSPANSMCIDGLQDRCIRFDRKTGSVQCTGQRRRGTF